MPATVLRTALLVLTLALSGWATAQSPESGQGTITHYNGKTLDEWIRQTRHDDPSLRTLAVMATVQFGDASARAVPALLARLQDRRDVSPRIKAVIALRFVALPDKELSRKVTRELAGLLVPGDSWESQTAVRYEAVQTLQRFAEEGDDLVPQLVHGTQDRGSWEVRLACVQLLGRVGHNDRVGVDERATAALLARLTAGSEPAYQVKLGAICALGAMGRPGKIAVLAQVVSTLEMATRSPNKVYAIWAYAGLVALGDKSADAAVPLARIAHFLTADREGLHTLEVRSQAAQALGALGERARSQVPRLVALLDDKETLVAGGACAALARIGDKSDRVLEAVIPLLDHKDPVRVGVACGTLMELGQLNAKAIAALSRAVERTDKESDQLKPMFRYALDRVKGAKK